MTHTGVLAWLLAGCLVLCLALLAANLRMRRSHARAVARSSSRLDAERDRQAHLAVIAERNRIAREMHDIVAHNLSVMIALADGASALFEHAPQRAREAIGQVADTGRAALDQMRTVLMVLRQDEDTTPALTPGPRVGELEPMLDTLRATGVEVVYRTSGSTETLPMDIQLAIYRVIQEAITNTVKHAPRANRVLVSIRRGQSDLRVVVDNNGGPGSGADTPVGHGLIGMRERIALHGGRLVAGPTPAGWRVSAWLPLAADPVRHSPRALGHRS
jgi:signal transduction histidine kinase